MAKPKTRTRAKSGAKATKTKKASPKKTAAKKTAAKKTTKKSAGKKSSKKKAAKKLGVVDATLFAPLTEGERADALRILMADKRLGNMAKIGRYRLIAAEPLVVKPPHKLSGKRASRIVVFDYAANRNIEAVIDLEKRSVSDLAATGAQPMLARQEEATAISIALADDRVSSQLVIGDVPLAAMHYWSNKEQDIAYQRRSAAVLLGQEGGRPALVAIVDLIGQQVADVVPAEQW